MTPEATNDAVTPAPMPAFIRRNPDGELSMACRYCPWEIVIDTFETVELGVMLKMTIRHMRRHWDKEEPTLPPIRVNPRTMKNVMQTFG